MKLETVRLDVADHIATVTMDRPPVNAQNQKAREELIRVFDEISARDDVRVAILTAAGKLFSAGADVKERAGIAQEPSDYIRNNRLVRDFFDAVADCTKPTICAVNGGAFGAGFALMLACDIMIASEDAYFVISELDVGLAGGGALPDGPFREVDDALHLFHRPAHSGGRALPARRHLGLRAA